MKLSTATHELRFSVNVWDSAWVREFKDGVFYISLKEGVYEGEMYDNIEGLDFVLAISFRLRASRFTGHALSLFQAITDIHIVDCEENATKLLFDLLNAGVTWVKLP